jgi:hypothetical protein
LCGANGPDNFSTTDPSSSEPSQSAKNNQFVSGRVFRPAATQRKLLTEQEELWKHKKKTKS